MKDPNDCPFCGMPTVRVTSRNRVDPIYYVECLVCHACGPRLNTEENAIVAWNKAGSCKCNETASQNRTPSLTFVTQTPNPTDRTNITCLDSRS